MDWLRMRIGPKLNRFGSVWHLPDGNGATLCGFSTRGVAVKGMPRSDGEKCRLCVLVDRHEQSKARVI